jgi:hypothetical protein
LNADGFTNAAAFVFIVLTLNIYAGSEEHVPPLKVWGLAAVIVLLGLAKPGTVFILPLLLLLPWRRIQPRGLWAALGAAVLLALLITAGYNGLGVQGSHFSEGGGQSLGRQLSLILANPLDFGMTFIKGNLLAAVRYFKDWTGVYGYWNGTVPQVVYWLFPLALLGSLLAEPKAQWLKAKVRLVMAGVFLAASAATALMFFTVHYTPGDLSSFGRQGRYFIFTAPLLYLSLAGLVSVGAAWMRRVQVAAVSLLTLTLVCYSFGIYATYYTWCGSTLYTFKSCSQPIYKNLDIGSTPSAGVNSVTSLSQGFTSVCGDVTAVDVYLKAKPEGDQGELRFSLVDGSGQVVASQEFPLASLKASKYLRLAVPPSASQHGPGYTLRLEAPDLQPPTTLQVATSAENQYREGDFWVGEKKSSDDLIFRYMCASAWKKHQ